MPNWCYNRLEVQGTKKDMDKFYSYFKINNPKESEDFKMEWFLPRPEEAEWYSWNIDNWGTKWDVCEPYIDHFETDALGNTTFIVSFDTAWSPPLAFFDSLTKLLPTLCINMEYEEPGMCFCGEIYYSDGCTDHREGELIQVSDCCESDCSYDDDDIEVKCKKCGEECETIDQHSFD